MRDTVSGMKTCSNCHPEIGKTSLDIRRVHVCPISSSGAPNVRTDQVRDTRLCGPRFKPGAKGSSESHGLQSTTSDDWHAFKLQALLARVQLSYKLCRGWSLCTLDRGGAEDSIRVVCSSVLETQGLWPKGPRARASKLHAGTWQANVSDAHGGPRGCPPVQLQVSSLPPPPPRVTLIRSSHVVHT
ncbi:hypothetical protein OH77DRAFT_1419580 [Trametes cingulata]|nr:hypothetical protein OH77DRAFT_1419580 [Trametes cingulata]